ncbi:restriction endonuclease subunit S [Methanofervidicoccus abyssi]|uniref:Type I restriction enzyme, S subunit n=1 Tax=Methanofervidicoccus abyssi TaxID=2082189 RepID=A0A401HRX9_9EURY|nr:restriction endonuclease subunit S [Methanofervidicoccus abyssi]GBF36891.1 type I restriction enzyme, S subunit [Methanofervidicoccus abyssi]
MSKFKQTEIGLIPEDWEVVPILDCCVFERGIEVGSKNYNSEKRGIPFIRVGNIAKGLQELVYTTCKEVKLCKDDDILIALDGSPGAVARGWQGAYASGIRKVLIKPNWKNKLNYNYLYFILQHPIVQDVIKSHTTGVTILHASKSLQYIKIPLPPLSEQKKIAKVLDKIQQAIEIQDRIIEQVRNLKKSLMQKLFTEGLYGEEQKETEIGLIPKSWKVVWLGEVVDVKGGKRVPKGHKLVDRNTGYPYIRVVDFKDMSVDLKNVKFLMRETYNKIRKYTISSNDIYISIAGTPGIVGVIPKELENSNLTENAAKLVLKSNNITKWYLAYFLASSIGQNQIKRAVHKANQPKLALARIKQFIIPLPPLEEQKQIAHILSVVDKKIEVEKKRKQVLKELFKTMLHKLMSGEIRLKEVEI